MAIISAGYPRISPDRPASIDAIQWARMASHLGAEYWVGGTTDWAVRPVSGADRTVTVGVGTGGGHGVQDEVTEPEPVQFEPLNSGTRWDTVVARRDWANAETTFVALRGGTARAIASRATEPGAVDEQPVALCQLQSVTGGTRIGTIDHLSPRVSPGGMIVHHPESLAFLTKPGAKVYVVSEGREYHRVLTSQGVGTWREVPTEDSGQVNPRNGYQRDLVWWRTGQSLNVRARPYHPSTPIQRQLLMYVLPAAIRPPVQLETTGLASFQDHDRSRIFPVVFETNGNVRLYATAESGTLPQGVSVHFQTGWNLY